VLKELKHDVKVGFDRFAKLAAMICNTKICIVNFLDDKMQYTSNEVNVIPWLHHVAVPKSASICAHTILLRSPTDIFEVPDTAKDWRFKGKVTNTLYPC
jgi:hypothetical protein